MSIPGFGDAVTLFDTTFRLINFINDLRHAQDDLMGLASEAHVLRVCLNAVGSDSCHKALYLYISEDQGKDLRTIIDTCDKNLEELNRFIASVAVLVEKKGRREGILSPSLTRGTKPGDIWRKRKRWSIGLRRLFAKCWAAYKFTMEDKQAYRNKLILPTQAVNVFLTSMTHVGLANMGRIMARMGGLPVTTQPQTPLLLPPSGDQGSTDTPRQGQDTKGNQNSSGSSAGRLGGWDIVGSQIAFKKPPFTIRRHHLTSEYEAEVLLYAKHLLKGGDRFSYIFERRGQQFKVTKHPVDKPPKKLPRSVSRSRSRSRPARRARTRDQMSLGKDSAGMFVRRRKSVVVPNSEETSELVDLNDDIPARRPLALPAPDYIEIQPDGWESDSDGSHHSAGDSDDDRGGGGGGGGGYGGGGAGSSRRHGGDDGHDSDGDGDHPGPPPSPPNVPDAFRFHQPASTTPRPASTNNRSHSRWYDRATYRHSAIQDLEARKREIEDRIQREQDMAMQEQERAEEPERRRRESYSRYERTSMTEAERVDLNEYNDLAASMVYLTEVYGIIVEPAPPERPPVDNGEVHSDDEDVTYDPEMERVDKLKAETSAAGIEPRTASYEEELRYTAHEGQPMSRPTYKPDPSEGVEFSMRRTSRMHSRMHPSDRYERTYMQPPMYSHYAAPVEFVDETPMYGGRRHSWRDESDDGYEIHLDPERRRSRTMRRSRSPIREGSIHLQMPRHRSRDRQRYYGSGPGPYRPRSMYYGPPPPRPREELIINPDDRPRYRRHYSEGAQGAGPSIISHDASLEVVAEAEAERAARAEEERQILIKREKEVAAREREHEAEERQRKAKREKRRASSRLNTYEDEGQGRDRLRPGGLYMSGARMEGSESEEGDEMVLRRR
jgi:uncharacterized membrane protein YgcG